MSLIQVQASVSVMVRNDNPDSNYGGDNYVLLGSDQGTNSYGWYKFYIPTGLVPAGATINSVNLHHYAFYFRSAGYEGNSGATISWRVTYDDGDITQDGLTWNNAPNSGLQAVSASFFVPFSSAGGSEGDYYADITSDFNAEYGASDYLSYRAENDTGGIRFGSSVYGNGLIYIEIDYTPATDIPTVSTQAVGDITATTATGNGTIVSENGSTVTDSGVCWATHSSPTLADSHATSGTGNTSPFVVSMTGLSPSTHYYVAAYATNGVGTGDGGDVEFDTLSARRRFISS